MDNPTPQEARQLFEESGWTTPQIATHYGKTAYDISMRLYAAGMTRDDVKAARKARKEPLNNLLLELNEQGLSTPQIAAHPDVPLAAIGVFKRLNDIGASTAAPPQDDITYLMHLRVHRQLSPAEVARDPLVTSKQRHVYTLLNREFERIARDDEDLPPAGPEHCEHCKREHERKTGKTT